MRGDITLRLRTARIRGSQQLRWCLLCKVEGTSLNVECYGETPAEAFADMGDALTVDDMGTLKWAAEHQEDSDA